jgi:hypothetical protein
MPLAPSLKRKKLDIHGCKLSLPAGFMKFLFSKLFITNFTLANIPLLKYWGTY